MKAAKCLGQRGTYYSIQVIIRNKNKPTSQLRACGYRHSTWSCTGGLRSCAIAEDSALDKTTFNGKSLSIRIKQRKIQKTHVLLTRKLNENHTKYVPSRRAKRVRRFRYRSYYAQDFACCRNSTTGEHVDSSTAYYISSFQVWLRKLALLQIGL